MKEIKNIIIVGGGNSGYMAGLALANTGINTTLIDPPNIPTIGVGESTQPAVTAFLQRFCNKSLFDYMPQIGATFKLGVMFEGWSKHDIFVDSENARTFNFTHNGASYQNLICAKQKTTNDLNNTCEAYVMSKHNKSPYLGKASYLSAAGMTESSALDTAMQWDQKKAGEYFKKECLKHSNFNLIEDEVVDVIMSESDEIKELILKNSKIEADLYIDSTGFKRLLIDKVSYHYHSFSKVLLNNRAIVLRKKYKDPQKECFPYTKATAMSAGWMWSIPTYDDMAHGYVHSRNFISLEQAEKELREKTNNYDSSVKVVNFSPGIKTPIATKNVIAIGLASSFIEPLEATNLSTTAMQIANFCLNLKKHDNKFFITENLINDIDNDFQSVIAEITSFIVAHYIFSPKNDSEYWKYIKTNLHLEEYMTYLFEKIKQQPPANSLFTNTFGKNRMFTAGHWFQLLYPYGVYNDYHPKLSDSEMIIGDINIKRKQQEAQEILSSFPNHYDYLTEWYESC